MAQIDGHSEEQIMRGLLPKKVTDAVLDALGDQEKLSLPLLESEEAHWKFTLEVLRLLIGRKSGSENRADHG